MTSLFKMDPTIKKKWVEALRSGEYKQGKGRLVTYKKSEGDFQFCCLGVLQNIYHEENNTTFSRTRWRRGTVSEAVEKWAGLPIWVKPTKNKVKRTELTQLHLADLNDHTGSSFTAIARWIEGHM